MNSLWRSTHIHSDLVGLEKIVLQMVIVLVSLFGYVAAGIAAEAGKLVEKDGKYVFVESMDPSMKLLLDRSVKSGLITQEEYNRAVQESEERAQLLAPSFKGWYDRGFNLSFNDNAYFLKIRFRAQLRYTQRYRNDAWRNPGEAKNFPELLGVFGDYRANRSENDASSFNVRRLRFYFMGHLI